MGAKNLSEFGNAIRAELYCDDTVHAPTQMDRAIAKTEALLGRLIPKKNIVETTITIDRTAEVLAISSDTGTTTYKPVKYDSEAITNATGTAMVRDTNYTINYMTGVITEIGALLPDAADYAITYEQDPQRLDIGTLIAANAIRITRIEYPVGDQPPTYLGFDIIEDFLILHKDDLLIEDKHLRIYYDSLWTAATASTDGEYPTHLDDAIIVGAAGQCLIFKAEEYVQSAVAELLLANAAVDSMATPLADINTALDKVAEYLETNETGDGGIDNAKEILSDITDEAATLRTRIDAILSKSNDFLFSADTDPSAKYYLTQGDGYIPTVNVAERVGEKFADYSRACIQLFNGLVTESTVRLDVLRSYIEESAAWRAMGETFVAEAIQRINEANAWAAQADRYALTSDRYMDIAGRYLASGQAKINEFFAMLGFKPEIQHGRAASSQATQY